MTIKKAILLIGSPKGIESSSASLGTYLLNKLEKYDIETEILQLYSEIANQIKEKMFLDKIEEADFLVLAAPLYVDTLPAKVIKALTLIAENRKKINRDNLDYGKLKSFAVIVNCGFPESEQNETALKIYQEFARKAKLKYLGGIAIGMGGAVSGKSLSEMGGMAKDLLEGLDQAADDIVRNRGLSDSLIEKTSKPLISQKWLYTLVGNFNWRFQALKNGVYMKINDRPYKKE
ncbi:MAG: NAD(P)H-dependent oxidoreductase [Halanaerobium sp.]